MHCYEAGMRYLIMADHPSRLLYGQSDHEQSDDTHDSNNHITREMIEAWAYNMSGCDWLADSSTQPATEHHEARSK